MSIGSIAGGGSTGIQRKENSKPNPTTETVDWLVKGIMASKVKVNAVAPIVKVPFSSTENPADTALISAAQNGELEKVEEILNQKKHGYFSIGVATKLAAINGHLDIVNLLLASKIGETLFYANEDDIHKSFPDAPLDIKKKFSSEYLEAIRSIFLNAENLKQTKYTDIIKRLAQTPRGIGTVLCLADRIENKMFRGQFLRDFFGKKFSLIQTFMSPFFTNGVW
ncbi:MAG: ankyrin repeat domain-containing protein [Chlamydiae bacterium]|nr:ankyrin repeat domain-containing protein [Chlamydiota bacterium]